LKKLEQLMLPMLLSKIWCEWCGADFYPKQAGHRFCCKRCAKENREASMLEDELPPKEINPHPKTLKYEDIE
jgi:hypothetical protein